MKKKLTLLTVGIGTMSLLAGCASSSGTYSEYVTLGNYKGLELSKIKAEVTDEILQEEIDYILEENTIYTEITDRGAKEGDEVNIDFTGTIDGESFDEGNAEDFDLVLGEGYMLEDFEAGIIDMKPSETKEVSVTFTEDYDETLAGQEAIFKITLNTISEVELPEYNDEFVAGISDFNTTAEYEADLKETLLQTQDDENTYTAGEDAILLVIENSTIDGYPQELYDQCKAEYDETNAYYAEMFGMEVSDFEGTEEETKAAVIELVNQKMVVITIAEKEKLEVTDEEYETYVQENYEEYGYESASEYESAYSKESIVNELLTSKVMEVIIENATITEVSEDEYYGDSSDDEYLEEDTDTEVLEMETEEGTN